MTVRGSAVAFAVALAVAFGAGPASGQVVTETSQVTLVEVPVQVLDAGGSPVAGLAASDFELYDRGRRQRIDSLEELDAAAFVRGGPDDLPAIVRRRILLLFDLTFSRPQALVRARLAVRDVVLESLRPSDLVAVMILTADSGPRFLVAFTSDRAQVARALDTLGAPDLLRATRVPDPLQLVLEPPGASGDVGGAPSRTTTGLPGGPARTGADSAEVLEHLRSLDRQLERQRARVDRRRVTAWARSMSQLARVLASVGGRKHVIYLSQGFDGGLWLGRSESPADAGVEGAREGLAAERGEHWVREPEDVFGDAVGRRDLRQVVDQLRRADAVVDAVDLGGLSTDPGSATGGRRGALSALALGTGGQLSTGLNDFGVLLESALESPAATYLLSFHPRDLEAAGSYHPLEVRLAEPSSLRVVHRAGYYAPRPFEDLHPLEKSLLASDAVVAAVPRQDLRMEVLMAAFRGGASGYYVPVILEIEGASLIEGQRSSRLETEIFAYVSDPRGAMKDFFTHRVVLDLERARERLSATGLKFYGHLSLAAGSYRVRVLARNAETGRTTVRSLSLTLPPTASDSEPRLLPPFFVEQPQRWLLARAASRGERVVYPFTLRGEPFVPAVRPVLGRGESAELVLAAYGLGAGPLAVESELSGEGGRPLPGSRVELVERLADGASDRAQVLARFDPRGLAPGSYRLEVTVKSGDREASRPLTVRVE